MVQIRPLTPPPRVPSTNWLYPFRVILLLLCSFVNAATLGITVYDFILQNHSNGNTVNIIGVASGVLTLVLMPVMLLVGRRRKNTLLVCIFTEIVIFGLLGTLWTITVVITILDKNNLDSCQSQFFGSDSLCERFSIRRGLSVAISVLLLFYALTLIIYAVVHANTVGPSVWFQTVRERGLRPSTDGGSVPATDAAAGGMWHGKPTNESRYEMAAAPTGGGVPGHTSQAPLGSPSSGIITYPPLTLFQAVSMQMPAANSVYSAGPALDASASSATNLPGSIGVESAMTAQQHHSPAPQQENMRIISRSSPRRQGVGLHNTVAYQGVPVTPPYPQV